MVSRSRGSTLLVVVLVLAALATGGAFLWARTRGEEASDLPTKAVERGPFRVKVLEGGSLQSLNPQIVASEVEGRARILTIVPEGTVITPADVEAGKVLVELDSADLRERLSRQEIDTALAQSGALQARANLDIQSKQNESDVRKAELEVRFAELELDKYLGATVAARLAEARATRPDVGALLADPALGGEAKQAKRQKESEIHLANEEVARARQKLEWSEKLLGKGYVSPEEKAADALALQRKEAEADQAKIALEIFGAYEATKEVEKRLSDLLEARENLERAKAKAESSLAQARADLRGQEEKLRLETARLERLRDQLRSTVIRAKHPGIVVYASGEEYGRWGNNDQPIKEGAEVSERQAIISLPDASRMGVRVNVHESAMDKVRVGQAASVLVDAFPSLPLRGTVVKVATMPNAANRWMNPDLKVYTAEIAIADAPATLRPGMSAKVEVLVEEIRDALFVPLQALAGRPGAPTVFVRRADGSFEERPVETGPSNDANVVVTKGLSEGEHVLLAPPRPTLEAGADGADGKAPEADAGPDAAPSPPRAGGAEGGTPGPRAGEGRRPGGRRGPRPDGGDRKPRSGAGEPAPEAPATSSAGGEAPASAGAPADAAPAPGPRG
jgi:HlyD family secretion protein